MYVTMMDPFQIKYGNLLSGALVLPSLLMDVLWVATTLLGLGDPLPSDPASGPATLTSCLPSLRVDHQRDPGPALRLLRLGLLGGGHHLHAPGGPLLGGLHRRHPAGPHLLQPGESGSVPPTPLLTTVTRRPCVQWLCVPFLLLSPASVSIVETAYNGTFQEPWLGSLDRDNVWRWVDDFLLLVR